MENLNILNWHLNFINYYKTMEKEKKELTITVSGQFCSGKSRLIFLLKKLLREQGFEVHYEGNLDHPNERHFDCRVVGV